MTTSLSPQRVLSHKSTLIGVAAPTPTRKDGTPIPLADTPPEGFHKAKLPKTDAPPDAAPNDAPRVEATRSDAPRGDAPRALTQQAIDAIKAASATSDPDKLDASTRVTRRDLPIQSGSRPSIPVAAPASGLSSSSRLFAVSAAVAALILGGRWFLMRRHAAEPVDAPPGPAPTGIQVVPPTDEQAPATPPSAEMGPAPAPAASATPEPSPAGSAAPSSEKPPGTRTVVVKLSPPGARLFRKGKPVPGASTVTIELGPDEKKRAYEVGMPGYFTRKLVVDGSQPEIYIGLKPR